MLGLFSHGALPIKPQPSQILVNRRLEFGPCARKIYVLDAQQKAPAAFLGELIIPQRRKTWPRCRKPFGEGAKRNTRREIEMLEQVLIAKVYQLSRNLFWSSPRLFDDRHRRAKGRFYVEVAGVERHRVCGGLSGAPRGAVAFVAPLHIRENGRIIDFLAASRQLQRTPLRPGLRVAVTKIFTRAPGQITVPMSRPSSTAPSSRAAKRRCRSTSSARTCGKAATTDAASPISRERRRASSKSVSDRPRAAAVAASSSSSGNPSSSSAQAVAR